MEKNREQVRKRRELTGGSFLQRRGLKRDQANYVAALIGMRADLVGLLKITRDPDIQEEIATMIGFMAEAVEFVYQMEEQPKKEG